MGQAFTDHIGHESGLPLRNGQELSCVRSLRPRAISREYLSWKLSPTSTPNGLEISTWVLKGNMNGVPQHLLYSRRENKTTFSFLPFLQSYITIGLRCNYFPGWIHKILHTLSPLTAYCRWSCKRQAPQWIYKVKQSLDPEWPERIRPSDKKYLSLDFYKEKCVKEHISVLKKRFGDCSKKAILFMVIKFHTVTIYHIYVTIYNFFQSSK